MTKKKVLATQSSRIGLGVNSAMIWFLMLERFNAPGWLYGVVYSFYALVVLVFIAQFWTTESITIEEIIKGELN
jgi:uncharacterized membrane protein